MVCSSMHDVVSVCHFKSFQKPHFIFFPCLDLQRSFCAETGPTTVSPKSLLRLYHVMRIPTVICKDWTVLYNSAWTGELGFNVVETIVESCMTGQHFLAAAVISWVLLLGFGSHNIKSFFSFFLFASELFINKYMISSWAFFLTLGSMRILNGLLCCGSTKIITDLWWL